MSSLLANLEMRQVVFGWKRLWLEQSLGSRIENYSEDLVILCGKGKTEEALSRKREIMGNLGLTVGAAIQRIKTNSPLVAIATMRRTTRTTAMGTLLSPAPNAISAMCPKPTPELIGGGRHRSECCRSRPPLTRQLCARSRRSAAVEARQLTATCSRSPSSAFRAAIPLHSSRRILAPASAARGGIARNSVNASVKSSGFSK